MLGLMPNSFEGFAVGDFDAFIEKKWSSNRYNLERMKVAGKLGALGKVLSERLKTFELALDSETSQPNPTIFNNKKVDAGWLYFFRCADQRRQLTSLIDKNSSLASNIADPNPLHRHVVIAVRINVNHVETSLRIHRNAWLDVTNLVAKLKDGWQRDGFLNLLRGLNNSLTIRIGDQTIAGGEAFSNDVLDRLQLLLDEHPWIAISQSFEKNAPEVSSPELAEHIWGAMEQLAPIYRFIAWSAANDFVAVKDQLKKTTIKVADVIKQKVQKKKAGITDNRLGPNRKVTIVAGLFERKRGIVESIDKKGNAKVTVGNMTINIPAKHLKVIG